MLGPAHATRRSSVEQQLLRAVERDPLLLERVAVAERDRAVLERLLVDRERPRRADLVLAAVALADRGGVVVLGRHRAGAAPRRAGAPSRPSPRPCRSAAAPRPSPARGAGGGAARCADGRRRSPRRRRRRGTRASSGRRRRQARSREGRSAPRGRSTRASSRRPRVLASGRSRRGSRPLRAPASRSGRGTRGRSWRSSSATARRRRAGGRAGAPRAGRGRGTSCRRSSIQYACHSAASAGGTKNSISICSNSRIRKRKLPGVISLRKLLPICAMPNGGLTRSDEVTFLKLTKMPWAVSGRRYASDASSRTAPTWVSNIRLNSRASVRSQSASSPGCFDGRLPQLRVLEVVGPEPELAGAAVDQRVGEPADVARGDPHLRVEDDRGVERDHVVALLDHRAPPLGLHVLVQQDAVVAVVEGRAEAAVDVRRRVDEAAPAAQRCDLLDFVTSEAIGPNVPIPSTLRPSSRGARHGRSRRDRGTRSCSSVGRSTCRWAYGCRR